MYVCMNTRTHKLYIHIHVRMYEYTHTSSRIYKTQMHINKHTHTCIHAALHACGNATDLSMESAFRSGAAYIMCPCCVGKLKFSLAGTNTCVVTRICSTTCSNIRNVSRAASLYCYIYD